MDPVWKGVLSGVDVTTAIENRWGMLQNGLLVEAANRAGFHVIMTQDKDFTERGLVARVAKYDISVLIVPSGAPSELDQGLMGKIEYCVRTMGRGQVVEIV